MASYSGEKGTRLLAAVLKNRPDSLLFARLADAYRKEGNIGQAIELCVNGLNNYPYYSTGRILLGRCYLEQQKYREAIEAFSMVCAADRRNQMAIKMLADIFVQQGMEQRAGDLYALLLKMDPVNPTLKRLCSQYQASPVEKDIFTILGLQSPSLSTDAISPAAGGGMLSSVEATPPEVMDYTVVEGNENEPAPLPTVGTDFLQESAPADDSEQSTGVSGADIADRMSILFGEQPGTPAPEVTPEQGYGEAPFSAVEDAGRDDGGIPETLTDMTDFNRMPEQRTDDAPETGLSSQDFDLSDISVETVQIDRRTREPLHDMVDNRSDAVPEESTDSGEGIEAVADAAPLFPQTGIEPDVVSQDASMEADDVSGADVSDRIEELFSDQPAKVKEVMPDADDFSTVDSVGFGEQKAGQPDDAAFLAPVDDQAAGNQETTGTPSALTDLPVQTPEDNVEELLGSDEPLNAIESSDDGMAAPPEAAEEPDLQLDDFPEVGETSDFLMESLTPLREGISQTEEEGAGTDASDWSEELYTVSEPPSPQESEIVDRSDEVAEFTGEAASDTADQVAGTDVSDRIEALFEAPVAGASEESPQNGLHTQEPDFSLAFADDELQTPHDEIVLEESSGSVMQTAEELFAPEATAEETAGVPSEESVFEPDMVSSDFAETMQFDSKLFEQMLNPSDQDVQFIEEESTADSVVGGQPAPQERSSSVDRLSSDAFEHFEPVSTDSRDHVAADDEGEGRLDEPPVEEPTLNADKQSFDLSIEEPLGSTGFEVTTEQFEPEGQDLMNNEGIPSDLVLDHTGTFEFETDTENERTPGLILDVNEGDDVSPVSGVSGEQDNVAADLIDDVPVTDKVLSDNTDVIEIAPSGEDVVEQLDLLFHDEAATERGASDQHAEEREQNDVGVDGEPSIVAAPLNEEDEEEAALIETMQITRDELQVASDAAVDEGFFEVKPVDEPDSAPPTHPTMEEQIDGPPVISGMDVKERLDDLFPAPNLMNLSQESALLPDDDQNEVMEQVSEFYTIAGEDASQGIPAELPEHIAEVEFNAASEIEAAASVDAPSGRLGDAEPSLGGGKTAPPPDTGILPEVELYEECEPAATSPGAEEDAAPQATPPDGRDDPFNIPDHVVTPTLADIYYQQGQCQLALRLYRRLVEREPDNELLAARVREIQSEIERGASHQPVVEPGRRSGRTHRRTRDAAGSARSSSDKKDDTRPLAGVHLKKQVKYAARKARKRKP
ncbi:MAG: tetratricopeptide repeat protein [Chitinispirillaceae bacterium]|nr:tetratricopeptide repeat protein [Chitinispirillaceae bacterium]